jgi:glycosyltransferase involved in cell wall biosynthesis
MSHILYTGAFRFPAGDAAAARVLNNAKIFRALGFEVTFISWGGNPQQKDIGEDGKFYYEGFSYINTYDLDVKRSNILKRVINHFFAGQNSIKIIQRIIPEADFVIGYNPTMFFTKKVLKLCKAYNAHFVSDITEWYDPNEFPGGRFFPPSWVNELNMRFTQKRVKNKIVISSFLDGYYHSSNNIILPPLVDSSEAKWLDLKSVLPPFDGIRLVYIGSPSRKDLLGTMLDAVIQCSKNGSKLQFVIVGVSKENISDYTNYQEVISCSDHIFFYGRVLQTEVPSYLNVSDFSIIVREPTRKNMAGFPTKLAETMMAGCPVLVNYTSDIEQYVCNGYNGFILSDWSSKELQKILSSIVFLSRKDVELMKSNAKKSALEKFNYSCHVDKMVDFISGIYQSNF